MSAVRRLGKRARSTVLVLAAALLLALIAHAASVGAPTATAQSPPQPQLGEPVSLGPQPPGAQSQFTGCGGVFVPVVDAAWEQEVVERVNAFRAENGVPPLKRVEALDDAARYHSADMAQDGYFDHNSYDRNGDSLTQVCGVWDRLHAYYSSPTGENIAAGYGNPEAVMEGWKNSSGHRANMLKASSWEIGVGYYYDASSPYRRYWTQDFGRRNGAYPLIIEGEAATTDSADVSLYIYGSWSEIRLRNGSGSWSNWQPFSNSMTWQLRNVTGERTVRAEMRGSNETASASDTIWLDAQSLLSCSQLPDLQPPIGVGEEDLVALEHMWEKPAGPPADRDGDGMVTIADMVSAAALLGTPCQ